MIFWSSKASQILWASRLKFLHLSGLQRLRLRRLRLSRLSFQQLQRHIFHLGTSNVGSVETKFARTPHYQVQPGPTRSDASRKASSSWATSASWFRLSLASLHEKQRITILKLLDAFSTMHLELLRISECAWNILKLRLKSQWSQCILHAVYRFHMISRCWYRNRGAWATKPKHCDDAPAHWREPHYSFTRNVDQTCDTMCNKKVWHRVDIDSSVSIFFRFGSSAFVGQY